MEGDDHCVAYIAIVWGRPLSRERYYAAEAEDVEGAEGNHLWTRYRGSLLSRGRRPYHPQREDVRNLGVLRFAGQPASRRFARGR